MLRSSDRAFRYVSPRLSRKSCVAGLTGTQPAPTFSTHAADSASLSGMFVAE